VEAFGSTWFYDPGVIALAIIIGIVLYVSFRKPRKPKALSEPKGVPESEEDED
jgi:hypothetical protein